MVIMIDKSRSMNNQFGDSTRMHFGITATKAVIASLNPNDNVRLLFIYLCITHINAAQKYIILVRQRNTNKQ